MLGHQAVPRFREAVVFHMSLPLELRDLGSSDIACTLGGLADTVELDEVVAYLCPIYVPLEASPRHLLLVTLVLLTLLQSLPLLAVLFGVFALQRLERFARFLFRLELQEICENACLLNVYSVQLRRQLS